MEKNAFNLQRVSVPLLFEYMVVNCQAKVKTNPQIPMTLIHNPFPEIPPRQVKSQGTPSVDLPNGSVKVSGTHPWALDPAKYQKDSRGKPIFHVVVILVQERVYTLETSVWGDMGS